MPASLTLGISPCPNDQFLFSGWLLGKIEAPPVEVRYCDVESLNRQAQAEELDIVKVSYAAAARLRDRYDLLPSGGALGRGVGPLLLSKTGKMNPNAPVLAPGENTTANVLLDYYAMSPVRKRFMPFDQLYDALRDQPDAQGVVINEKRFSYQPDGLRLVQDLGAFWEEKTGLPIPLGGILARKSLGLSEEINTWIVASLDWAQANRAEALDLCRQYAADPSDEAMESHIRLYVNEWTRDLGVDGRAAVERFFSHVDSSPAVGGESVVK